MRHSLGMARPLAPIAASAAMRLKAVSRLSRIPAGTGGPHGTPASGDGRAGPGHAVEVGLADVPGRVAADRGDGPEGTRSSPDWAGSPGPGVARAGAPWGGAPAPCHPQPTDLIVMPAPRAVDEARVVRPGLGQPYALGHAQPGSRARGCPGRHRRLAPSRTDGRPRPFPPRGRRRPRGRPGSPSAPLKSLSSATHGIGR